MSTPENGGPAQSPSLFERVFGFLTGVAGSILSLAKLALTGHASPSQTVFFACGTLGLLCVAAFGIFAYQGQAVLLFVTFAVLALVFLVTISLMAWILRTGGDVPPGLTPSSELVALNRGKAALEREVAELQRIKQDYEVQIDGILSFYESAEVLV